MRRLCSALFFLSELMFLSLLCSLPTFGQIDRAVLEGAVTDQTGAVMSRAKLKIVELETGLSQKKLTNAEGYYRFPGLAVGRYSVTVTSDKFKTQVINDVTLRIGETRTLNDALQVGTANEHMRVDAVLIPAEKASPEAATVIDTEQIETLPNNGRDWASFT